MVTTLFGTQVTQGVQELSLLMAVVAVVVLMVSA
jgi:hypothetical protein